MATTRGSESQKKEVCVMVLSTYNHQLSRALLFAVVCFDGHNHAYFTVDHFRYCITIWS